MNSNFLANKTRQNKAGQGRVRKGKARKGKTRKGKGYYIRGKGDERQERALSVE